jgi:hypothetical protein
LVGCGSKQKKELMYTFGRLQGIAGRRLDTLRDLSSLDPIILDEHDAPCRVLMPDEEFDARRSAWNEFTDEAVAEQELPNTWWN